MWFSNRVLLSPPLRPTDNDTSVGRTMYGEWRIDPCPMPRPGGIVSIVGAITLEVGC